MPQIQALRSFSYSPPESRLPDTDDPFHSRYLPGHYISIFLERDQAYFIMSKHKVVALVEPPGSMRSQIFMRVCEMTCSKEAIEEWCRRRDLNSHRQICLLAPQASVSTNSTTPALAYDVII